MPGHLAVRILESTSLKQGLYHRANHRRDVIDGRLGALAKLLEQACEGARDVVRAHLQGVDF